MVDDSRWTLGEERDHRAREYRTRRSKIGRQATHLARDGDSRDGCEGGARVADADRGRVEEVSGIVVRELRRDGEARFSRVTGGDGR